MSLFTKIVATFINVLLLRSSTVIYGSKPINGTNRGKILLVEDEPMLLRMYQRILRGQGEFVTARNGAEGVERFLDPENHHQIKLVVTDNDMPEMKGVDFLARLKEISQGYDNEYMLPARIMVSGRANQDLYQRAKGFGAGLYAKPFEPIEFKTICQELIDNQFSLTLDNYHRQQKWVK